MPPAPAPAEREVTTNKRGRRTLMPYVFLAPAIALFVVFLLIPIGYAIYLSFQGLRLVGGGAFGKRAQTFVGLDNYQTALTDPEFVSSFGRLAIYGLIAVPFTLGLALLFALLLDHPRTRTKRFSRTAIFIPYAVPGVVASLMWGFMYLPSTSPFSYITEAMGGGADPVPRPAVAVPVGGQHRDLGRRRLQHDHHLHRAARHPGRHLRLGPDRRGVRLADRPPDQDSVDRPRSRADRAVLADRHAAGLRRTDHARPDDVGHHARPGCR